MNFMFACIYIYSMLTYIQLVQCVFSYFLFLTFLKQMHIQCIHLFFNRCYNLYCTFLNADKCVIVYNIIYNIYINRYK